MDRGGHRRSPSADGLPTPGPVHLKRTLRDDAQWRIRYLPARSIFLHSRAPDARQSSHVLFLFTSRIPASVAESKRSSLKVPESFRIPSTSVSFLRPHPSDSFFIHRQPSTPIDDHRPPSSNVSGSPPGDQNTRDTGTGGSRGRRRAPESIHSDDSECGFATAVMGTQSPGLVGLGSARIRALSAGSRLGSCVSRLVKLRTSISVITLQKLPAETLTCLHIDYLIWLTGSHEEIGQLFAALSRFTRLKSLILAVGCKTFPGQWTELHDRPFSNLFTNMIELEEVEITFPLDNAVDMDAVIETLVHNCPSVSSITMNYARTTNVILHSLSRLTRLHHLVFRSYMGQSKITTEGILSLLRGGSRNVLRDLELHTSVPPDLGQIRAEGQLMRQETGRSLSVNRDRSSYDDHQLVKVCVAGD